MLDIADELKLIYKNDAIPLSDSIADKQMFFYFPNLDLTITNNQIKGESFQLTESICSEEDLTFGGCESAQMKVTVADVEVELSGQLVIVTQVVNETYTMPFGSYIVESVNRQSDRRFKDIVAYDRIKDKLDKDVSSWYNAYFKTIASVALKKFRIDFFSYLGMEIENQDLPNDNMTITKTIEPTALVARDLARAIGEINGRFGHMTREDKFKYIGLNGFGLYPSETLFPSEDLYPSDTGAVMGIGGYRSIIYEDYKVKPIDKLVIRSEEGDAGQSVGTGSNAYILQGNFLVFGKNSEELGVIANKIFKEIKGVEYRPHTTIMMGLPYLEVGDTVSTVTTDDVIESFVFHRVLTGVQALTDTISATGAETRNQEIHPSTQIMELENRTLRISKSVDNLTVEIKDSVDNLESKIELTSSSLQTQIKNNKESLESQINQTTSNITQNVTDIKNNLQGQIDVQAGDIELKVDNNGVIQAINMSKEGIKISATKLDITGVVTISDLQDNTLTINGGKIYIPVGGAVFLSQDRGNTSYGTALSINGTWDISLGNTNRSETNIYGKNYIKLYTSNESLSGYTGVVLPPNTYMRKAINSNSFGNSGGIVAIMKDLEDFVKATDISRIYSESTSSRDYYLTLNSSRALVPNYSSSYPFHLGSSSYPFADFFIRNINHLSGTIGFFGKTPISKKSVSAMTTSADLNTVHSKLNELIKALGSDGYGLV